ncbi:glycosyl hydrolase 2 galactose-binding domain-containing protein [Aestuariimicrobium soli]|uniref:glycoside hydrolase family 2 protein n=1 Tax=Aestuariimicrobium soli TaxID=2035834 RepID=UPI003EC016D2
MKKQSLSAQPWTLHPTRLAPGPMGPIDLPPEIPATVPGSVHTDLLAADLIRDPFWGQNELGQFWIGQSDWAYSTTLPGLSPAEGLAFDRVDLVFDGLDTIAAVTISDDSDETLLGRTDNMHRRHRFDVTGRDTDRLRVAFSSPVDATNAMAQQLRPRHHDYPHPYNAIRKMACSFGWDWGIATASSGIWRDVRLEGWTTARLGRVQTDARPVGEGGRVTVRVEVERARPDELTVEVTVAGTSQTATIPAGQTTTELTVDLERAERWWPVGHGDPVLHDCVVVLAAGGRELDRVERRLGFRTVEWPVTPDEHGIGMSLHVNGRLVEVRGVNWIPDDPFPHRVTRERLETQFGHVLGANLNLVRIWGGGLYESEDFYDLADELGLLVWQDFTFACAAYAEEEPLFSTIIAEARDNVSRLGHRASLVLWNGNNENLEGFQDWGWQKTLDGHTWGERYYYTEFPAIVAELAPTQAYLPGSPWTPLGEGISSDLTYSPNEPTRGSMHSWATWNRLPATAYRSFRPRFVAEYGWQAPPAWTTLQTFGDDAITPTSPGTFVHQKASSGNNNLTRGLLPNAPLPTDLATWHWALQWQQADAIRLAIEWFRSLYPVCTGNIVWQLNDCWPVISWAAVDGLGHVKPLLHAMRHANAPRLLTIQPDASGLRATLVNDTDEPFAGEVVVRRCSITSGEVLDERALPLEVGARGAGSVDLGELSTTSDEAGEYLAATLPGGPSGDETRGWWFFVPPRDSRLGPARVRVTLAEESRATLVTVTAETLVRDLTLLVDKADPDLAVDGGMVTLRPGESHTFAVSGSIDLAGVERALASLNDLVNDNPPITGAPR